MQTPGVSKQQMKVPNGIRSFHHMDLGDQTQVVRLGSRCLYHLDHLPGFKTGSHVARDDLGLRVILPPSRECWAYRCVPSHLASNCLLHIRSLRDQQKHVHIQSVDKNNCKQLDPKVGEPQSHPQCWEHWLSDRYPQG